MLKDHKNNILQDNIWKIIFMFARPAAWFTFLIYVIGRQFIPEGGVTPTWVLLSVTVIGNGAEMVVGLYLLQKEGFTLSIDSLKNRLRLRWPKGWKNWTLVGIVFILGMSLSMAMGPVNRNLAAVTGFIPPNWWPAASNPTIKITSAADVFSDISLPGNFGFLLLYFAIGLFFNICGEKLYYRGFLMPRMRGVFGRKEFVT